MLSPLSPVFILFFYLFFSAPLIPHPLYLPFYCNTDNLWQFNTATSGSSVLAASDMFMRQKHGGRGVCVLQITGVHVCGGIGVGCFVVVCGPACCVGIKGWSLCTGTPFFILESQFTKMEWINFKLRSRLGISGNGYAKCQKTVAKMNASQCEVVIWIEIQTCVCVWDCWLGASWPVVKQAVLIKWSNAFSNQSEFVLKLATHRG